MRPFGDVEARPPPDGCQDPERRNIAATDGGLSAADPGGVTTPAPVASDQLSPEAGQRQVPAWFLINFARLGRLWCKSRPGVRLGGVEDCAESSSLPVHLGPCGRRIARLSTPVELDPWRGPTQGQSSALADAQFDDPPERAHSSSLRVAAATPCGAGRRVRSSLRQHLAASGGLWKAGRAELRKYARLRAGRGDREMEQRRATCGRSWDRTQIASQPLRDLNHHPSPLRTESSRS